MCVSGAWCLERRVCAEVHLTVHMPPVLVPATHAEVSRRGLLSTRASERAVWWSVWREEGACECEVVCA